ncbi:MAG TPA: VOC family protein [Pirellulales bacterium]|jgi:PhnB protein|nr:VOC family protein [Pirellulales bacterium]
MLVQTYLFFEGQCEEALEFYQQALGAKVEMLMRYGDAPDPVPADQIPPGSEQKILHVSFRVGESVVMASDGHCSGQAKFGGFAVSLQTRDAAEAQRLFQGLSDGGKISMPIGKTFFSPCFGMVVDRFGITWMVNTVA